MAIKNALRQENINPDIEEKLLNLQRCHEKQMKGDHRSLSSVLFNNHHEYTSPTKQTPTRKNVPLGRQAEDNEWILETPKRRPPKTTSFSEKKNIINAETVQNDVNRIIRAVAEEKNVIQTVTPKKIAQSPQKTPNKLPLLSPEHNNNQAVIKGESEKKKQLQIKLYRQKEQLKKDILKKRIVLEKDLQIEIQRELAIELANGAKKEKRDRRNNDETKNKSKTPIASPTKKRLSATVAKKIVNEEVQNVKTISKNNIAETTRKSSAPAMNSKVKRKHKSSAMNKKKEKLYCICRTPYDDSKFYVGCDLCNNWFHGDCVKITEQESKDLSEFICSECKHARDTQELFCLCRKPYDETQFYICCDKCQDWFHGRCVGVLQSEAESIDEYICPNCQDNSSANFANMKDMGRNEYDELRKLIKQIQSHKSSWPFMQPVDQKEAPDYYDLIKDPMDLQRIESKINEKSYNKLSDFIADMTKIFDNCRFYNPKESPFYKCAESLESFFVQKIKHFRESLSDKK